MIYIILLINSLWDEVVIFDREDHLIFYPWFWGRCKGGRFSFLMRVGYRIERVWLVVKWDFDRFVWSFIRCRLFFIIFLGVRACEHAILEEKEAIFGSLYIFIFIYKYIFYWLLFIRFYLELFGIFLLVEMFYCCW